MLPRQVLIYTGSSLKVLRVPVVGGLVLPTQIEQDGHTGGKQRGGEHALVILKSSWSIASLVPESPRAFLSSLRTLSNTRGMGILCLGSPEALPAHRKGPSLSLSPNPFLSPNSFTPAAPASALQPVPLHGPSGKSAPPTHPAHPHWKFLLASHLCGRPPS